MRILLLNQYAPPDPSPTARLAGELAEVLRARGHEVEMIHAGQDYGKGAPGGSRWLRETAALVRILWRALAARRAGLVVCMSSPPCLAVVGKLAARVHGARLRHWVMDVYPDLAVSLGEVREGLLTSFLSGLLARAYSGAGVGVLDGDMRERLEKGYGCSGVRVVELWAPAVREGRAFHGWEGVPAGADVWLYSGNLGRAHDWKVLLAIQQCLERGGPCPWLVVQGGGEGWREAREEAVRLELRCCHFAGYVEEEALLGSLLAARVAVGSMKPEVRGQLWPSKLALLLELPRPLLWVGDPGASCAREVAARGNSLVLRGDEAEAGARWIQERCREVPGAAWNPEQAAVRRQQRIGRAADWVVEGAS